MENASSKTVWTNKANFLLKVGRCYVSCQCNIVVSTRLTSSFFFIMFAEYDQANCHKNYISVIPERCSETYKIIVLEISFP